VLPTVVYTRGVTNSGVYPGVKEGGMLRREPLLLPVPVSLLG